MIPPKPPLPDMPMKEFGYYMIQDWTSDQDPGDEDDGLKKVLEQALKHKTYKHYEFDNFYF